jgi:hypothetical protein
MSSDKNVRWLKGVYLYNIVGAGSFGLGILAMPELIRSLFGLPDQDPIVFGVMGSMWLALGLVSMLGLRSPVRYAPVLLLQLSYKVAWFAGVVLPLMLGGRFPSHGIPFAVIFATYIIGDLVAIPFPHVLARQAAAEG